MHSSWIRPSSVLMALCWANWRTPPRAIEQAVPGGTLRSPTPGTIECHWLIFVRPLTSFLARTQRISDSLRIGHLGENQARSAVTRTRTPAGIGVVASEDVPRELQKGVAGHELVGFVGR